MRKYLLGIIVLLSIGSYSYAGCTNTQLGEGMTSCIGSDACVWDQADCPSAGTTNTTCKGISPASDNSNPCIDPAEDKKICQNQTNSSSKTTLCSQRYSCESLFESNPDIANACNFARCENDRGIGSKYCACKYKQKGIPLNTSIPFIGNCITKKSNDGSVATNAFPTIIGAATRILVTVIMLVSFVMVVIGGIQWASGNASDGKKMITKVATGFILLGLMGAILRLINPNFFK